MTKEDYMANKKQETKAADNTKSADTQQAQNPYVGQAGGAATLGQQYTGQQSYSSPRPDYYQLSYLKRPHEGAAWERLTEYFPTHDESTTRALALSAGGDTACVRTLPRYWVG